MPVIEQPDAAARLARLQGARDQAPWARRVQVSRATLWRITQDKWPDAEALRPLARIEGVSLSWLVAGVGAPFAHQVPANERIARALLTSGPTPTAPVFYAVYASGIAPLLLVRTEHDDLGEPGNVKKLPYTWHAVVILRPEVITRRLLDTLRSWPAARGVAVQLDSADEVDAISANERGNYQLFGDDQTPGLLPTEPNGYPDEALEAVARELTLGSGYRVEEPEGIELQQRFDRAHPDQRAAVLTILRGLTPDPPASKDAQPPAPALRFDV